MIPQPTEVPCPPMSEDADPTPTAETDGPKRKYGDFDLYKRLLQMARPFWSSLVGLFFLSLLAAPLALLMPVPVKIVVDHVLGDQPLPGWLDTVLPSAWSATPAALLWTATIATVVIAFLVQIQDMALWLGRTWVGRKLVVGLRTRIFDHLQRLSLGWHYREGSADSLYRLQFDAPSIESVAVEGLIPFATAFVKVVVLTIAVMQIDWVLALIAVLGGPALFGITELFRGRLRRRWSAVRERESAALQVVQESLGAIRVVKAFGQEDRERGRFKGHADDGVDAAMKAVWAHGFFDVVVGLVVGIGGAAILYVGAQHVISEQITLGELLLVLAYLAQLFHPLREVGTRVAAIQGALASAERVFAILDEVPDVQERPNAKALPRCEGRFAFKDVTFGYIPENPVISDVAIEIPAGSKVGIAGRTGSGKSTLLSLLPRFYDPQQGHVVLDGHDLRDLKLSDLRQQYGIVLQEPVLFNTSVRENIAYGRPGATEAEIVQAAKDAAAHAFITELEHGYDSVVGERGMSLSGGERQRVSLARAFLRNAPVLILDEPTSALDTGTESEVMDALERLMKGRTTFMIAHRLTTLASCDIRLEVSEGKVLVRRREDLDQVSFK